VKTLAKDFGSAARLDAAGALDPPGILSIHPR
jgi:hypothetical protein